MASPRKCIGGGAPIALLMSAVTVWLVAYAMGLTSLNLPTKLLWAKIEYVGIVTVPLGLIVFAIWHTRHQDWHTRHQDWLTVNRLLLLAIIPTVTLALVWTNEEHGLIWARYSAHRVDSLMFMDKTYGAGFWVHLAYDYVIMTVASIMLIRWALVSNRAFRRQAAALLIAVAAPWLGNTIYLSGRSPVEDLDLTPIAFTVSGLMLAVAVFRFRLLDVTPMARVAVMEGMHDGLVVLDGLHRIADMNPAAERILGVAFRDVLGRKASEVLPARSGMLRLWGEDTEEHLETALEEDDQERRFDITATPLRDGRGATMGRIIVFRDVTEHRQTEEARISLEEQLRESQRIEALGRLAGGVAHEFNNMLTPILAYASLSMNAISHDHPAQQYAQRIHESARRAATVVDQILAFAGRQHNQPRALELDSLVQSTTDMLGRLIGEDITLSAPATPGLGTIEVDPVHVEQLLVNMTINARDAMPDGGRLTIETANVTVDSVAGRQHAELDFGEYLRLTIRDTGVGIDEEIRGRIFEPFFTTKRVGESAGLGLALCHGIVKQSGGDIRVSSVPGHGTTFEVYFPRVERSAAETNVNHDWGGPPSGGKTILLVEDEPSVREVVAEMLREQGYAVLEAEDGRAALSMAKEHGSEEIHLLLTDVIMPVMGGIELAHTLKDSNPTIEVLFMTGYVDGNIIPRERFAADINVIRKPFASDELAHKVSEVLDKA